MNILITGATGFVGHEIIRLLLEKSNNHPSNITIVSRKKSHNDFSQNNNVKFLTWDQDFNFNEADSEELKNVTHVINLVGENISNKRWSEAQKELIYNSRIKSTRALISALNKNAKKLEVFIQTSAIGIYPANSPEILTEESEVAQNGFLSHVCKDWENTLEQLPKNVRKVIFRVGVVLDQGGGALAKMDLPFKMGVGGKLGSGKQMMSWIHRKDLANLYTQACADENFKGVYNAVAPHAITNAVFTKTVGKVINRPTIFPVPEVGLKLLFGEMSSILLDSQHVVPKRLSEQGFKFCAPDIESAIKEIYSNH